MSNNKDRADFMCAAYRLALRALKIVEDVYEGTLKMRDCGVEYLPRNPAEDLDEYAARLKRSVFPPFFRRALGKLAGLVFAHDPTLKEVGAEFEAHWKNIDLAGTPGEVFAQNAFTASGKDGFALIYVDLPPAVVASDSVAPEPTAQDEADADLRPFWVLYKRGQLVNWRESNINGKTVLTLAVLKETTMEDDGVFGEKLVTRYRVLKPGTWELYRSDGRKSPAYETGGTTNLDYIPLFPTAPLDGDPQLLELALMNVQLFNKQSDLDNILHIANVPVMWVRDRNTNVPFQAVGPTVLIDLKGEHSAMGFAEHEGKAIDAAQKDIASLKTDMVVAALELLAERAKGPQTATGEIIDSAEANSELSLMVKWLQGALASAKRAHFQMLGQEPQGSIELNIEYQRLSFSVEEIRVLKELAMENMLSIETLLELLKRAGKLGKDFNVQDEIVRLFGKDGEPTAAERAAQTDDPARSAAGEKPPADASDKTKQGEGDEDDE